MRGETRGAMPTRLNETMSYYWTKTLHGVGTNYSILTKIEGII
ncbi:hypothetical protein LF1_14180 [Rubripirellula obstinata]|uniref:Uncharacterized protein n=1 Tax=Rubripirellula obstinata TaxID=406547 RepID=A0A5B1CI02_9BACT|nr:hypothetical protein LF1_14180 [Rubripirellula obstinata]